jgi:iron complex transport system substrate-binding protein
MKKTPFVVLGVVFSLVVPVILWGVLGQKHGEEKKDRVQSKRIVSLALPVTEILCLLGREDRLIAIHEGSCPPTVEDLPRVGKSYGYVNVEVVMSLKPDLVFCWKGRGEALHRNGLAVFEVETRDIEGVIRLVSEVGKAVGESEKAEALAKDMRRRVSAVQEKTRGVGKKPNVYFEGRTLGRTRGPGSLTHELITQAGGVNIAGNLAVPFPLLSNEYIIEKSPEIILVEEYGASIDELRSRGGWSGISAVASGRVHVSKLAFTNYTPRCIEGLEQFARWFHPDLFEKDNGDSAR